MSEQQRYWVELHQAFEFFAYILNNIPEENFVDQMRKQFLELDSFSSADERCEIRRTGQSGLHTGEIETNS
mgnify:CR=1 FL=1